MRRAAWIFLLCFLPKGVLAAETQPGAQPSTQLSAVTTVGEPSGEQRQLKSWTLPELQALKPTTRREKDPDAGKVVNWRGVQLSTLVDLALEDLPASQKAAFDLIVLHGREGKALVPRWFVQRYPMLVAYSREKKPLGGQGPLYTVVPWTSVSKISKEAVPLENFFVTDLRKIEFSNYRQLFGRYYLRRRSDPAAVRGEKLFVQSCATCHGASPMESHQLMPSLHELTSKLRLEQLAKSGHPAIPGVGKLSDREIRALHAYVDEFKAETSQASSQASGPAISSGR